MKASLGFNHFEVQSNFAITRNLGLSADINGGFNGQFGGEVAGIYYRNLTDRYYFETRTGYGYYNNQADISDMAWDLGFIGGYGKHYSQSVSTNYHKIFIQPAFCYHPGHVSIGVALKIGANYFENYHYGYNIYDNSEGDYSTYREYSNCDFKGQWGVSFEPAVKIQFNSRFFLQWSGIFTGTVKNSPVLYKHYPEYQPTQTEIKGDLSNPSHVVFLFTIGYEFKFGKKKESP